MVWIYAIPAWLFISASVAGSCALAAGSLLLWKARAGRSRPIAHNDVAGPILTTIGTVLAVMMSFMVVGVWQEYDAAAQTAQHEASAASDLHHIADAFPEPFRSRVQTSVDRYIGLVIVREWPLMKSGRESRAAHDQAYRTQRIVAGYQPRNAAQQTLQARALDYAGQMLDARRDRIMSNREGIPIILWVTMLVSGFLTVAFSFYFRVARTAAHVTMIVALTAVIALTFTLIAELDYPFRGDEAIRPWAFVHILRALHGGVGGLSP